MSPRSHLLRTATAALVIAGATAMLAGIAMGAMPAFAADEAPTLTVSRDGVTFTPDLALGMFADLGRIVPGDERSERAWARSGAPEAGRLRVDLYGVHVDDAALAAALSITVTVADTPGRTVSLADAITAGGCVVMSDEALLAPGETRTIDARLVVDARLGEDAALGQNGTAGAGGSVSFMMRATLSDAAVPGGRDTCSDDPDPGTPSATPTPSATESGTESPGTGTPGSGTPDTGASSATGTALPATGTGVPATAVLAGVLLTAVGTAFVGARTRTRARGQRR